MNLNDEFWRKHDGRLDELGGHPREVEATRDYISRTITWKGNVGTANTYLYRIEYWFEFKRAEDVDTLVWEVGDVVGTQFKAWMDTEKKLSPNTIYQTMTTIGSLVDYVRANDPEVDVPVNNWESMAQEVSRNDEPSDQLNVPLPKMREYLMSIRHPRDHALHMTLLKTGARRGEVSNLDLSMVNLDDADARWYYDKAGVSLESAVSDRPDHLVIPADIKEGDVVAGERREEDNKRMRTTVIPIDDELKTALIRYLAIRPLTVPTEALFIGGEKSYGRRLTGSGIYNIVRRNAARFDASWVGNSNSSQNMSPHTYRHWLTTHLRFEGDDILTEYIRGESGSSAMQSRYSHGWQQLVTPKYLDAIPKVY